MLDGVAPGILGAALTLIGIGIGFANAPLTSTALAGLPSARAGVAGGMASTARQLGVAVATSIVVGAEAASFAAAAVPIVGVIIACGAVVLAVAALSPHRRAVA
ncbi:hypothetical protein [Microbacterium karelineae]|uniref:hypothetical protein n=1 Tax=Microbacterium karelineae TaxID=2654283 RepID=UPI0012EA8515|nr:hypothetical protein [Microbacterium karelineae]